MLLNKQDGIALNAFHNVNIHYDGQGGSKVYICDSQLKDAGWYQCTAYNDAGSSQTRARIQINAPATTYLPAQHSQFRLNIKQSGRLIEQP